MANYKVFKRALKKVDANRKTSAEKARDTKQHSIRMCEMQRHVNMSKEKRTLLLDVIKNTKCTDCDKTILQKGVIVFIRLIEVIEQISEDLTKEGIQNKIINSKTSSKERLAICDWFMKDPNNKVVLLGEAGAESISVNATNEIILYDIPNGSGKFNQTIGRICRMFGEYDEFFIHYITVEETLDEYKKILLSSKKELEEEILGSDTIELSQVKSFDADVLKKIKNQMLWKLGKRKKKP